MSEKMMEITQRKGSDRGYLHKRNVDLGLPKDFLESTPGHLYLCAQDTTQLPSILPGYSWLCPKMMAKLTDLKQRDGLVAHNPMEQKEVREDPAERHILFSLLWGLG